THAAAPHVVRVSPDGRQVAWVGGDRLVHVLDIGSGATRGLSGHADDVTDVAYAPDGRTIVSAARDGDRRTWDAANGQPGEIFRAGGRIARIAVAPDGGRIAARLADRVVVLDRRGGEVALAGTPAGSSRPAWSADGTRLAVGGKTTAVYDAT